jgi:predicted TIM-barrel fold metal-dependent hydrolase
VSAGVFVTLARKADSLAMATEEGRLAIGFPIVDAQLHEPVTRLAWTRPSDGRTRRLRRDNTTRKLFTELSLGWMDAVGVASSVLFPTYDEAWAAAASAEFPERFSWVGRIQPEITKTEDLLERGAVALRLVVGFPRSDSQRMRAEYEAQRGAIELAAVRDVPVFLLVSRALDLGAEAVCDYPNVRFVIDHLGLPQPPSDKVVEPFRQLPFLVSLASYPNLMVKVSGIPSLSSEAYPYEDVWPHLRTVIDAFGADRVMWGSDISRFEGRLGFRVLDHPVTYQGKHTYAESLHYIRETRHLTAEEKEQILGGSVRRLLKRPLGIT